MTDQPATRRDLARAAFDTELQATGYSLPRYARQRIADAILTAVDGDQAQAATYDRAALLERVLDDADHHKQCARLSAAKNPHTPELAATHDGMAAGLYTASAHIARGNPALLAQLKQHIDQPEPATLATGYCPHCGRGDAGPTADQYEQLRTALAALHEGEEEPASVRLSGPTPAEWIWLWNQATPARRLEVAAQIIDSGQRAGTCFQADHETTIQRLRADQAAVARVRAALGAVEHEAQAMNPYDRDPAAELERIRAALNTTA